MKVLELITLSMLWVGTIGALIYLMYVIYNNRKDNKNSHVVTFLYIRENPEGFSVQLVSALIKVIDESITNKDEIIEVVKKQKEVEEITSLKGFEFHSGIVVKL